MSTAEEKKRAERVRERGREERSEAEAEASRREAREEQARERARNLLAASCHPLSFFVSDEFESGAVSVCILAIASSIIFTISVWNKDERTTALIALGASAAVSALLFAIHAIVRGRVNAAWQVEAAWLVKLPFSVQGLNDGVASTSSGHQLRVSVSFEHAHPMPIERAQEMLRHVDPGGEVRRSDGRMEITARVAGEPESDVGRVRGRRLLLHDLVDGVLLPMHDETPIKGIVLDD